MRISFLPIFLALATSPMLGVSTQQIRVVRQLDIVSSITDMASMMSSIMSMMVPAEVMSVFPESFQKMFFETPFDFSSLATPESLGRKRRANYPWEKPVTKFKTEFDKEVSWVPKLHEPLLPSFQLVNVNAISNLNKDHVTSGSGANRRFSRSPEDTDSEGGADMQQKAIETGMKGVEIAGKMMEGGQMVAKAGSDMAQAGKSGAEGLGSGAEMMSGAAETIGAGAGQGANMAQGFSGAKGGGSGVEMMTGAAETMVGGFPG